MTSNQIAYWKNVETERSNRANEAETHRANVAKESETFRHNNQTEKETWRHNYVNETNDRSEEARAWLNEFGITPKGSAELAKDITQSWKNFWGALS